MSDTPQTDAAIKLASDPDGAREVCDLCERLERELSEARAEAEKWHHKFHNSKWPKPPLPWTTQTQEVQP